MPLVLALRRSSGWISKCEASLIYRSSSKMGNTEKPCLEKCATHTHTHQLVPLLIASQCPHWLCKSEHLYDSQ